MLTRAKAYLTPRQRRRLFARARRDSTSLSAEVRRALELYLQFPPGFGADELRFIVREVKASSERSTAKLNETINQVERTIKHLHQIDRGLDRLAKNCS